MTADDKKLFPCDFAEVQWSDYSDVYISGIAEHLLMDKSDKATLQKNATKWKYIHYFAVAIFYLCVASLFYMVFRKVFL